MLFLAFFFGITFGLLLAFSTFWLIKIKCPQCKKPTPLRKIIVFNWKSRQITGQPCPTCQKSKTYIQL